ncbi:MAG: isoaspartyl peptidase/L-asparaginase [Candidatus Kapabacteria bacterium]|nr:isoaspartyl peptidase/L-asparaginase [Candidatus Kapabacteria bacterium]
MATFALALHGGAGDLARYRGSGRLEEAEIFMATLLEAMAGRLRSGTSALDVAMISVEAMEDSGLFHAGRGSSPTSNGLIEMDASIMHGRDRKAGAIAVARTLKNPIRVARYVMEHTPNVFLAGQEVDDLASAAGSDVVGKDYFIPCDDVGAWLPSSGTVGAVILDSYGDIVAATSTGGTLRKRAGRIGDTPVIGAGTYADNNYGGISCTGVGEYFLRTSAASRVISRIEHLGEDPNAAAEGIMNEITTMGGHGGMIVVDKAGRVAMPFNTSGMYRASIDAMGTRIVASSDVK